MTKYHALETGLRETLADNGFELLTDDGIVFWRDDYTDSCIAYFRPLATDVWKPQHDRKRCEPMRDFCTPGLETENRALNARILELAVTLGRQRDDIERLGRIAKAAQAFVDEQRRRLRGDFARVLFGDLVIALGKAADIVSMIEPAEKGAVLP